MKVSIILTALNDGSGMAKLLGGMLAQSATPEEIAIVDGVSADATIGVIEARSRSADQAALLPGVATQWQLQVAGRRLPTGADRFGRQG